jgi:hypothetical protein
MQTDGMRLICSQLDFSGGINSNVVPIRSSDGIPHGLMDSQLSWANNCQMRGGGVYPRFGWVPVVESAPWSGIFQGGAFYQPDEGEPQLIVAVSGRIYRIRTDTDFSVEDISAVSGFTMDPTQPQYYFAQAEKWLVIQDGTIVTNPLFFYTNDDGSIANMSQSNGFVGVNNPANQIPPAGPMDYYQQRLWYAFGRFYAAGDIVFNQTSGTAGNDFRDSVLAVTENPVPSGGDAFVTPISSGNIRWLRHAANLDSTLGQTNLFIGTRNAIFACNAPITRADWIAATLANMPLQTVALVGAGAYSERGATPINNDILFCSTPDGDVRSLQTAVRQFNVPGQIPISNNVNRALDFNDRALLHLTSSIYFDTKFYQTVLPFSTPVGTAFKGIISLDYNPLSSLQESLPPIWESVLEGLNILQMFQANIAGRDRAFAMVYGATGGIDLWEFTVVEKFNQNDFGQARTQWSFETAAYAWGDTRLLKEIETFKFWIDRLVGTVEFRLEFKPDQYPCWLPWRSWKECSASDCTELFDSPCMPTGYPTTPFCELFKSNMTMPKPPTTCIPSSGRSANLAYTFQLRLTVKGWCRIRGIFGYALPKLEAPFSGIIC